MITIVCVFGARDLGPMVLQARSIGLFVPKDTLANVVYVFNGLGSLDDAYVEDLRTSLAPHSLELWLADGEIVDFGSKVDGWLIQQALKLQVAHRINSDYYVVLDAKNHFIRPISLDAFVADEKPVGSVTSLGHLSETVHSAWIFSHLYFKVDPTAWVADVIRPITPFVFRTRVVEAMVETISFNSGLNLLEFFGQYGSELYEFFLYQAFLHGNGERLSSTYRAARHRSITIWLPLALSGQVDGAILSAIHSPETICFGLHHSVGGVLSKSSLMLVDRLWRSTGLLRESEDIRSFMAPT